MGNSEAILALSTTSAISLWRKVRRWVVHAVQKGVHLACRSQLDEMDDRVEPMAEQSPKSLSVP